jgi:hypothetical protein
MAENPGPPAKTPSFDKLLKTLVRSELRLWVYPAVWTSGVEQVNPSWRR